MYHDPPLQRDFANLTVAIVGDILHSRVARSDIHALTTLGVPEVRAVGPLTLLPTGSSRWRARVHPARRGHPRRRRDHHAAAAERAQRGALLPARRSTSATTG